ncbi:MAG TPA: terminase family protein, partial [Novosphingobium sp.]|nr:terminase family protein [Novosphingobium sp.]
MKPEGWPEDPADLLDWLLDHEDEERLALLDELGEAQREEFATHWRLWARRDQLPPDGGWRCWLVMAGRGFGKTRAGAEWVRSVAEADPDARIALVGASLGEARAVMVEGESGLLAISPPPRAPVFEPSLKRLTWPNGAQAMLYSAQEPESLRGPQHSHAWCDEVAKWANTGDKALAAWDNLLMGLRLGEEPRLMATTTPRAVPLLTRLLEEDGTVVTKGRPEDNATNLPERFIRAIRRTYGKSMLGRQELDGELIEDLPGALWTRALLEACRGAAASAPSSRAGGGLGPPAS